MRVIFKNIIYSFPVQLLALHLKRYHFLVLFWLFLIGLCTGVIGTRYGISYLFLDPEYLGKVNFSSFCILGAAFGAFVMVWNVTSYILNAHSFSFLATLNRPFNIYCLNNSILPILFFIIYIFELIAFQSKDGLLNLRDIFLMLSGFFAGMFIFIIISIAYFFRTNKDIFQIVGIIKKKEEQLYDQNEPTHHQLGIISKTNVEHYINHKFRWKLSRSADHYPESVIKSVYKQHHANALFIELTSLILIISLGLLMDNPIFRIPAGASILLLFTILIVVTGSFSYWLRAWKLFFFIVLIIIVDVMMRSTMLAYRNKAYGINYDSTSEYTIQNLKKLNDSNFVNNDTKIALAMLENWKNKFDDTVAKPKMVFINCSGGGLRAMSFVMQVLQHADSITGHKLMYNCPLITGASGGMISAAYYRELYLRYLNGEDIDLSNKKYSDNMSSDILNAVGFTIIVNDLFYPWQKFDYGNNSYRKDRGYMFEKILNENTDSILFKPLADYKEPEFNMQIPMMIFYPTIINDERKLFIASEPVSYLGKPANRVKNFSQPEIDGVDIHYLLKNNSPDSVLFTSVLRMNSTFPYILPNVHLPTKPEIELMDAGIRDNYGIETSARFIEIFNKWINENTSGVVIVNIRAIEQERNINVNLSKGVFEKITTPVENLYINWLEIQDYQNDYLLNGLYDLLNGNLEVLTFAYQPSENNKKTSLSLHLTTREKRDIENAVNNVYNKKAYDKLGEILK